MQNIVYSRRIAMLAVATAISLAGLPSAYGLTAPALRISDGSRVVTIDATGTVAFSGSCTGATCFTTLVSVQPGAITWGGTIGVFSTPAIVGLTKPVMTFPDTMDINVQALKAPTGGTLQIQFSDTNFTIPNVSQVKLSAGGLLTGTGSLTLSVLGDSANNLFGGNTLATIGPLNSATLTGTATGPGIATVPFSLTEQVAVTLGAGSTLGIDFDLSLVTSPPPPISCRMTGGGVDTSGNWDHTLTNGQMITNGAGKLPSGIDRYQFGGQVGAPTASQPQPSGEWQHNQQTGPSGTFSFHTGTSSAPPQTRIVEVRCSDPGYCNPARPAPAKQLDWDGIGSFQNLGKGSNAPNFQIPSANVVVEPTGNASKDFTLHWVQVNVDDLGEPGNLNSGSPDPGICPGRGFGEKSAGPYVPDPVNNPGVVVELPAAPLANCACPDFYRITIFNGVLASKATYLPDGRVDPTSLDRTNVIYEVFGYIDGGNLQIHPPTGSN